MMNANNEQYAKENNITIMDAYDVLNLIYGNNGLLPNMYSQEKALQDWCKKNNAYLYSYHPRQQEVIRWSLMQAKEKGNRILVLNMLD